MPVQHPHGTVGPRRPGPLPARGLGGGELVGDDGRRSHQPLHLGQCGKFQPWSGTLDPAPQPRQEADLLRFRHHSRQPQRAGRGGARRGRHQRPVPRAHGAGGHHRRGRVLHYLRSPPPRDIVCRGAGQAWLHILARYDHGRHTGLYTLRCRRPGLHRDPPCALYHGCKPRGRVGWRGARPPGQDELGSHQRDDEYCDHRPQFQGYALRVYPGADPGVVRGHRLLERRLGHLDAPHRDSARGAGRRKLRGARGEPRRRGGDLGHQHHLGDLHRRERRHAHRYRNGFQGAAGRSLCASHQHDGRIDRYRHRRHGGEL